MPEEIINNEVITDGSDAGKDTAVADTTKKEDTTTDTDAVDTYTPFNDEVKKKSVLGKDEDDDKELSEDEKLVRKQAKQVVSPLAEEQAQMRAEMQVNTFLSRPESKIYEPYADQIREVAKDRRVRNFPMDAIVAIALGPKKLMKLGGQLAIKAQEEANSTSVGGDGARQQHSEKGMKNAFELTSEEFNKVMHGARH